MLTVYFDSATESIGSCLLLISNFLVIPGVFRQKVHNLHLDWFRGEYIDGYRLYFVADNWKFKYGKSIRKCVDNFGDGGIVFWDSFKDNYSDKIDAF